MTLWIRLCLSVITAILLTQCGGYGVLMGGPSPEARNLAIASEATGNFHYGRRYHVEKTRFWGYLRQPRQPWSEAKLVMMLEDQVRVPDRLPEDGPEGQRHGYDQNFEYRIHGSYTGNKAYDPNSNQLLPVFRPTSFDVVDRQPGWIFTPQDRYHPKRITLRPR